MAGALSLKMFKYSRAVSLSVSRWRGVSSLHLWSVRSMDNLARHQEPTVIPLQRVAVMSGSWHCLQRTLYSNEAGNKEIDEGKKESGKGRLTSSQRSSLERVKQIIKEYGTVAVVFHTVMSLTSVGICYMLVKM